LGSLPEGAGGSTLEIDCRDRQWSVRSNAETASEARVLVQWSAALCPEARLRVSLPDRDRSSLQTGDPARLTRVYPGKEGFQALVQEFKDGSHTFAVSDFRRFYTPEQWQALDGRLKLMGAETVRIHLSVSPTVDFAAYLSSSKAADQIPTNILSL
jgi:hypothetical protein